MVEPSISLVPIVAKFIMSESFEERDSISNESNNYNELSRHYFTLDSTLEQSTTFPEQLCHTSSKFNVMLNTINIFIVPKQS